jgi:hypothetical protein
VCPEGLSFGRTHRCFSRKFVGEGYLNRCFVHFVQIVYEFIVGERFAVILRAFGQRPLFIDELLIHALQRDSGAAAESWLWFLVSPQRGAISSPECGSSTLPLK